MKKILTLTILIFYASSIFAQIVSLNQGRIQQKHYFQEIPYQEIKGNLIVQVSINEKNYNFIFDTGAPLVISDKLYKELHLRSSRHINANDAAGERKQMRSILLPEIHLQGITFRNIPGLVLNEDSKWSKCYGIDGIDGIIGSNMLRNSVVQFDEQNKQIIITDNIKKLALQTNAYQKMRLQPSASNPYIEITLQKGADKTTINNVLFDSGDGSDIFTLSLHELKLVDRIVDTIAESEGSFAFSGAHEIYKKQKYLLLNIPELIMHNITFNDVTVTTTYAHSSRIGVKLIQYGKTTLDYKKRRFYFEPFDNINTNQPTENQWAIYPTFQNDKWVVGIIWDKQLESQVNLGDEVLSINGIDTQSMSFCEFFMLEIPSGDKRVLELRDIHTGEIKKVEVERLQVNKDKEN